MNNFLLTCSYLHKPTHLSLKSLALLTIFKYLFMLILISIFCRTILLIIFKVFVIKHLIYIFIIFPFPVNAMEIPSKNWRRMQKLRETVLQSISSNCNRWWWSKQRSEADHQLVLRIKHNIDYSKLLFLLSCCAFMQLWTFSYEVLPRLMLCVWGIFLDITSLRL